MTKKTINYDLWVLLRDKRQYKKAMRQHLICAECTEKMFDNVAVLLWQQQQPAEMPELHYYCRKMVVELLTTPQDPNGPASMSLFLMRQWYRQLEASNAETR